MDAKKAVQNATDEMMDEFQLTELESRLEMTVALTAGGPVASMVAKCECALHPEENPECYGG